MSVHENSFHGLYISYSPSNYYTFKNYNFCENALGSNNSLTVIKNRRYDVNKRRYDVKRINYQYRLGIKKSLQVSQKKNLRRTTQDKQAFLEEECREVETH